MHHLDTEIRPGLHDWGKPISQPPQVGDDIRAIAKEKREEFHAAEARDGAVDQVVEAIERIDGLGLEKRVQHPGSSGHEHEPGQREAEEEHRREHRRFDEEPLERSRRARIQHLCQRRGRAHREARACLHERQVQQEGNDQDCGISGPTQRTAPSRRDSHVVRLRALCRGSVPPLAGRHRLAAVQRGRVTELRAIAHGRIDVEHAPFADERVPAEGHRSGLEPSRLCPVTVEDRFPADHGPCADREEVGAYRHAPGEDHDAGPDFRAQSPQIEQVHGRTYEHAGGRARSDERLDDPEADVSEAPQADPLRLPTADEHPLRRDRNGADKEESRATRKYRSQTSLDGTRAGRDPPVARGDADYGEIGVGEEKEGLQRSA